MAASRPVEEPSPAPPKKAKTTDETYVKLTLREQILLRPDSYGVLPSPRSRHVCIVGVTTAFTCSWLRDAL